MHQIRRILIGYIIGDNRIEAREGNALFRHEYGHYIQSQWYGPFFINKFGIPSLLSRGDHLTHPVEQDANRRAFNYFQDKMGDNLVWDFNWYPTDYRVKLEW